MRDVRDKLGIPENSPLYVAVYTPGDSRRRYRFFLQPTSYFASEGLATVLGRREAVAFVNGFLAGYFAEPKAAN